MAESRAGQRHRGRAPRRTGACAAALIAALLMVLAPLGRFVHLIVVPHGFCSEHGEFVDLHPVAHAPALRPLGASKAALSADPFDSDGPEEADHCQVLAAASRLLALPPADPPGVLPPALCVADGLGACEGLIRAADLLLMLAPKTSPPRLS